MSDAALIERPMCRVCNKPNGEAAALDPCKPADLVVSYLHPECARSEQIADARRRALARLRLSEAGPLLLALVERQLAAMDNTSMSDMNYADITWQRDALSLLKKIRGG